MVQASAIKKLNTKVIVGIAVAIILVIAAIFAAVMYSGGSVTKLVTGTPQDFSISLSDSSGTVMQGNSIQTTLYVNQVSGNPTVSLSADSGSSGIDCSFSPSSGTPTYSGALTMSVPTSTPTNSYSITVTASGGGATHSTSYTINVLSAQVYVSGTVQTTGTGTHPTQIQFADQQTGITYTASLSGTSYSVTLQNGHSYTVTVSWAGLLWSSGTYDGGTLYVNAGVGVTTQTAYYSG